MSQTNAQLLADSLGTASTGTVPIGGIILWSGSTGSIPNGWALCNGGNGTPNLQNRFVVSAGSGYAVGATGGSANAVLVSHGHSGGTASGTFVTGVSISNTTANTGRNISSGDERPNVQRMTSASLSVTTGSVSSSGVVPNGGSGTNANLPPYYALAYIMRTS